MVPAFNPSFLIAVPQLGDPNFSHSIVLMLEQDENGALGLVINDPTDLNLGAFAQNHALSCHDRLLSLPVMRGGPVEPAGGWLLHTDTTVPEKQELLSGLFLSGSQDTLRHLLASGHLTMRLILGYAGWGAGQLEEEMAQGAWLSTDVTIAHIFETELDRIWHAVLSDMGIEPSQLVMGGGLH